MSWHKVTLTGDMAKRHCLSLPEEIFDYHISILDDDTVPYPTNKCYVYKLSEEWTGETCTYYFTPDAAKSYMKLIEYYGGEACFKPSPSDVVQAIGGKDATKFLNEL
jgi:hypothetical protein